MFALTVSGTFIYALTLNMIFRLVNYAVTCAALPILRRKRTERAATFTVPAGVVVSIVAVTLCIWLVGHSGWRAARDAGLAAAFGLIVYIALKLARHVRVNRAAMKDPAGTP